MVYISLRHDCARIDLVRDRAKKTPFDLNRVGLYTRMVVLLRTKRLVAPLTRTHLNWILMAALYVPSKQSQREIKGVIFDMDGTLTVPVLDFQEMRRRLKIPKAEDILLSVLAMPPEQKAQAMQVIDEMEEEGSRRLVLQSGVLELLHWLAGKGLRRALVTRNSQKNVDVLTQVLHERKLANGDKFPLFAKEPFFSKVCCSH